jgi:hypothetical protein
MVNPTATKRPLCANTVGKMTEQMANQVEDDQITA